MFANLKLLTFHGLGTFVRYLCYCKIKKRHILFNIGGTFSKGPVKPGQLTKGRIGSYRTAFGNRSYQTYSTKAFHFSAI